MMIDLIRHADTGRRGYFDGRCDVPLLPDAARRVSEAHLGIAWTRIISSPRIRARDTAYAIASERHEEIELSEDWAEWQFGDWDGRHRDEIAADAAGRDALDAFQRDPLAAPPANAEPWMDFDARIRRALYALIPCADDDRPLLVVTHAGALRMAIAISCAIPLAALWCLRIDYGTRVRLRMGVAEDGALWGELIELRQPCDA